MFVRNEKREKAKMTEEMHLGVYEYFKRFMHIVKHNIKKNC